MTGTDLNAWCLRARLALGRLEWGAVMAGVLCVAGAIFWLNTVPMLRTDFAAQQDDIKQRQRLLESARHTPPLVRQALADQRADHFYSAIGDRRSAELHIKTLLDIATQSGVTINQAEYKSAFDKSGGFHTYQMLLPVKGSYSAMRRFCELTLMAIPFASLDETSFKREAVAKNQLEAKLRFTFYLTGEAVFVPPSTIERRRAAS